MGVRSNIEELKKSYTGAEGVLRVIENAYSTRLAYPFLVQLFGH